MRVPTARASVAQTPPSCSFLASECSATARTSRPRGWRASSTSTPSTSCAAPRRSPPTPPSTKPRSSASNTGHWKRPSWLGCPSRSRWPPASHWSPAPPPVSARPSHRGWRPRAPAWSSPTSTPRRPRAAAEEIGTADVAVGIAADVTDEEAVQAAIDATAAGVRRDRHRRQQRRTVAVQVAAGNHRRGLGPAAQRDGPRFVPGVEGRRQGA